MVIGQPWGELHRICSYHMNSMALALEEVQHDPVVRKILNEVYGMISDQRLSIDQYSTR